MSDINGEISVTDLYKKIDNLPDSIQEVVKPKMNIDTIKNISIFFGWTIYM